MKPFFSIAIPTWDIKGKGAEYLEFSFNRIGNQTFDLNRLEVVISDHSEDGEIKKLCTERWNHLFNITYIRNDIGKGMITPNLNNTLRHSKGEYIKILFQDDFLYDENSLQIVYDRLIQKPDIKWLVTACAHTKDAERLYDIMTPRYHDEIYKGNNTISCPTVLTIKNDKDLLYFNEDLHWLIDVEYYKRLFDKFGLPEIVEDICVVNRDSEVRTTNMIDQETKIKEILRLSRLYDKAT